MAGLWQKYNRIFRYLFWGAMTTAVNYVVYFLCTDVLSVHYLWSNGISWVAAVLFAFGVNKRFVFSLGNWMPETVVPELAKFTGARVFSGAVETGLLWLLVELCVLPDGPVKVGVSAVTVVLNYFVSKLFVFGRTEYGENL